MLKGQKGITLIALVVTIIVLLILAAVTIAALTGDNGILTNAAKSKQETALGEAKDLVALAINEATNAWYEYTYLNGNNTVGGANVATTQVETAVNFINAIEETGNATIEAYQAADNKYYVVIETIDNNPKSAFREITSRGGLTGKWTVVTADNPVPEK